MMRCGTIAKTVGVTLTLSLVASACTSAVHQPPRSVSDGAAVKLQILPIPEGPIGPAFVRGASTYDKTVRPMDAVAQYLPVPFPSQLDQPANCSFGGDLVATFADGTTITYGPCNRPASINRLWAAMIYAMGNGQCAPRCGPNGEAAPQTQGQ